MSLSPICVQYAFWDIQLNSSDFKLLMETVSIGFIMHPNRSGVFTWRSVSASTLYVNEGIS